MFELSRLSRLSKNEEVRKFFASQLLRMHFLANLADFAVSAESAESGVDFVDEFPSLQKDLLSLLSPLPGRRRLKNCV